MSNGKRIRGSLSFVIIFVVGIVFVFVLIAGLWLFSQRNDAPSVRILNPAPGERITAGEGVALVAQAQSPGGVQRVEFYVDGELQTLKESETGETGDFQAVFPWFGSAVGTHELKVIAYDERQQPSDPATVQIGVEPRSFQPPQLDFVWTPQGGDQSGSTTPGEVMPVSEAAKAPAFGGDGQGEYIAQPAPQEEGELAVGDENVQEEVVPQEEDEILGEPIDAPDNDPPTVLLFDVRPVREGDGVYAHFDAQVEDDVGLQRLTLSAARDGAGGGEPIVTQCGGELQCETFGGWAIEPGSWTFTLVAYDTSGQATNPQLATVEVVPDGNGLVAIADHLAKDFQLADVNLDAIGEDGVIDQGLVDQRIFEPQNLIAGEECISVDIEPRSDGNQISAEYHCEGVAPEGRYLAWRIYRRKWGVQNFGFGAIPDFQSEHQDKTNLNPGDTLSYLDTASLCGTNYDYQVSVEWILSPEDYNAERIDSRVLSNIQSQPCPPGSLGDVQLRAELVDPENPSMGVNVSWRLLANPAWPGEELQYSLYRIQPERNNDRTDLVFDTFSGEELQEQDKAFSFTDEQSCDYLTYYILSVSLPFGGLPVNNENLVTSAPVAAPAINCEESQMTEISLNLTSGYSRISHNGIARDQAAIYVEVDLPPNFRWTDNGNPLQLKYNMMPAENRNNLGLDFESFPIRNPEQINLPDNRAFVECGGKEYDFYLSLFERREDLNHLQPLGRTHSFTIQSPPCPPSKEMAPNLLDARGSDSLSECGETISGYCILLNWEQAPPVNEADEQTLPTNKVILIKRIILSESANVPYNLWAEDIVFSLQQNSHTDLRIPCLENEEAWGFYDYKMVAGADTAEVPVLYGEIGDSFQRVELPICGEAYNE